MREWIIIAIVLGAIVFFAIASWRARGSRKRFTAQDKYAREEVVFSRVLADAGLEPMGEPDDESTIDFTPAKDQGKRPPERFTLDGELADEDETVDFVPTDSSAGDKVVMLEDASERETLPDPPAEIDIGERKMPDTEDDTWV